MIQRDRKTTEFMISQQRDRPMLSLVCLLFRENIITHCNQPKTSCHNLYAANIQLFLIPEELSLGWLRGGLSGLIMDCPSNFWSTNCSCDVYNIQADHLCCRSQLPNNCGLWHKLADRDHIEGSLPRQCRCLAHHQGWQRCRLYHAAMWHLSGTCWPPWRQTPKAVPFSSRGSPRAWCPDHMRHTTLQHTWWQTQDLKSEDWNSNLHIRSISPLSLAWKAAMPFPAWPLQSDWSISPILLLEAVLSSEECNVLSTWRNLCLAMSQIVQLEDKIVKAVLYFGMPNNTQTHELLPSTTTQWITVSSIKGLPCQDLTCKPIDFRFDALTLSTIWLNMQSLYGLLIPRLPGCASNSAPIRIMAKNGWLDQRWWDNCFGNLFSWSIIGGSAAIDFNKAGGSFPIPCYGLS